jgi:hypothetical protein
MARLAIHRRGFLQSTSFATVALSIAPLAGPAIAEEATQVSMSANNEYGRLTRVKSILEVRGQVRLKNHREGAEAIRTAEMESKTTLQYEERFQISKDSAQAVIHFQTAESANTVEKHPTDVKLRPESHLMLRWTPAGESSTETGGVDQPLTEVERKLSESPIVSIYLENLLPTKKLGIGEKEELLPFSVAQLFNLDAVQQCNATIAMIEESDTEQELELRGELSAAVNAVPTKMSFIGKLTIDRQQSLVKYFAVSINEERDVGYAEPGFKVTARLRLIRESLESSETIKPLNDYAKSFAEFEDKSLQLFESKDGGYRFFVPSQWVTYKDSEIDAVLRLVKSNRSIGQCNIVNLADMEPGKQLTIEAFKADLERSLGSKLVTLLEENERLTDTKLRMMRVVMQGKVEGIDVIWVNMLISNDEGRHVSLAFTANADRFELMKSADIQIADTFEFTRRLKTKEELATAATSEDTVTK